MLYYCFSCHFSNREQEKKKKIKRINFFLILPPVASCHMALSWKGLLDFNGNDGSKYFVFCLSSVLLVFSVTQHRAAPLVEPVTAMGVRQHSECQSFWVWQNGRMTEKRRQNHILSEACRNLKSNSWQEITRNPAALNMNHHNELSMQVLLKTV